MQYTWSALIIGIATFGISTSLAIQAIGRSRIRAIWGMLATFLGICLVTLHNIFWERSLNENASKGWTLLYTLPTAAVCLVFVILATIVMFRIWPNRVRENN
jgi:hypothetical protein